MSNLLQDLKYAVRVLRKTPGYALAAMIVLALGIGANTAIFSVVNAVLLRPLPFADPDRLVQVWHTPPAKQFSGRGEFAVAAGNFLDWKKDNHVFERLAIYAYTQFNLTGHGEPESVAASRVDADFFPALGVPPLLGRWFLPEEDQLGREREVILSHGYWQSRFGGERSIVGQNIMLNGKQYTVVGVMGPRFQKPGWAKLWTPMAFTDEERVVRGEHHYLSIGRLKEGVSLEQAQAEMDAISRRLEKEYPQDNTGWGAVIKRLREETVGEVRKPLLVLLGAVAFVLLIACANVANLVLAKTLARRKEVAIRAALGASRPRLLRQTLSETVMLALAGGALGVFLAGYGVDLIVHFLSGSLPPGADVRLDPGVLGFTFAIAIVTGIVAGLLPAWRLANTDVAEALKQGLGRTSSDSGGSRTRDVLVVTEVALSLMLLAGAGLMIRTLWALHNQNPGFDPRQVLAMTLSVPDDKYANVVQQNAAIRDLLQRLRAVPGVEAAAGIDSLPISGDGSTQPVAVEGHPAVALSEQPEVAVRVITPGYLSVVRIPVLRGRDIGEQDSPTAPAAVLVSESMAKRFWPNEDAVGKRLTLSFFPGVSRTVVGVVGDVKQYSLDEMQPVETVYFPVAQITKMAFGSFRSFPLTLAIRTKTAPESVAAAVVSAIRQIDASTPVVRVQTMEEMVAESLVQRRFNMLLLATFAGVALLLAAVGIYSVLAYSVRRRLREIGIRMALGAQSGDVLRMVVFDGLKPTLIGVAMGLAGALALGRVVQSLLFGVTTTDVPTFAAVSGLLVAVGLAASVAPAYRATRVEPIGVLRDE